MARIVGEAGSQSGKTWSIDPGLTLGREAHNTIAMPDNKKSSRDHAKVWREAPGKYAIADLGSTNGTRVGEVTVRDADLLPGAVVQLGASAFRVEVEGQGEIVPLSPRDAFGELVGESVAMRQLYSVLERVAPTDATLLLTGETGTGKDVAARSVHAASPRRGGPFVPVDCGAIPESLIESELFGHVRGAFTGAIHNRKGAFEEAHGGTLFLDEIGEMPVAMQAKLLRALESRSIRRVGATGLVPVDVRVIAATHRDLEALVGEGRFRHDLLYRLDVVHIVVPPLRERREDIPLLVEHLLRQAVRRHPGAPAPRVEPEALQRLIDHAWPGNVRELRNVVERLLVFADGDRIDAARIDALLHPGATTAASAGRGGFERIVPLAEMEQAYLRWVVDQLDGNVSAAAARLGIARSTIYRLLRAQAEEAARP